MMFQKITRGRTCPVCKSPEAYRVKRAGLSVKIVCKVLNLRPQWCPQCDTFFLGPRHSKSRPSMIPSVRRDHPSQEVPRPKRTACRSNQSRGNLACKFSKGTFRIGYCLQSL